MIQENNDEYEWSDAGRIPGVSMLGTALCWTSAAIVAFLVAIAIHLEF